MQQTFLFHNLYSFLENNQILAGFLQETLTLLSSFLRNICDFSGDFGKIFSVEILRRPKKRQFNVLSLTDGISLPRYYLL